MVSPTDVFRPLGQAAIDAFDDTRSWVDPNGYRLSDRVWRARDIDSGAIDQVLRNAIASGDGAVKPVKALSSFLSPTSPGGNYGARRIARTETTRAFGQEAMRSARANPFVVGMKWNKSSSHRGSDVCDKNAQSRSFQMLGPGEYWHEEIPPYPGHPLCKCFLTPVLDPDLEWIQKQMLENLRKDAELAALQQASAPPAVTVQAPPDSLFDSAAQGLRAVDRVLPDELLPPAGKPKALREVSNPWFDDKLTYDQKTAVIDYTGDDYLDINEHLRGIGNYPEKMQTINELDAALAKIEVPEDIIVYRGVRPGSPLHFDSSPTVGEVLREPGYTSTSIDRGVSDGFTYDGGQLVEIVVPKGSHAAYVEPFSQAFGQDELLIHRDADLRVLGVSSRGNVVLELVRAAVKVR